LRGSYPSSKDSFRVKVKSVRAVFQAPLSTGNKLDILPITLHTLNEAPACKLTKPTAKAVT